MSRKLKKIKEKNTDSGVEAIHVECIAKDEKIDAQKSFEEGNLTERKGWKKGVESKNISKRKKVENSPQDPKPQKSKKFRFANELETSPDSGVPEKGKEQMKEVELVQGKRFSAEEDEIIKEAVHRYIEKYDLGHEGLNKVLNARSSLNMRGCWKEIVAAIPYRPSKSVYHRAQKLFRSSRRPWTEEEYEFVRQFQKKHGNKWKAMAEELGRYSDHVGNAWVASLKLPNRKKGRWTQEECQTLFDLVNTDLQLKVSEEKKSNHGMLRDNICWMAISEKLTTRNNKDCCRKWYHQLTSPMVAEGKWTDADDYRLVGALYNLDESSIENVDWDNLLDHRSGEVSLRRWKQMIRHIGNHESKSFGEQVEILSQRYCPNLLEAREVWDSKPYVD